MLKFNVESRSWTDLSYVLGLGRFDHSCAVFGDTIIISGGCASKYNEQCLSASSTEVIQIKDWDNLNVHLRS